VQRRQKQSGLTECVARYADEDDAVACDEQRTLRWQQGRAAQAPPDRGHSTVSGQVRSQGPANDQLLAAEKFRLQQLWFLDRRQSLALSADVLQGFDLKQSGHLPGAR